MRDKNRGDFFGLLLVFAGVLLIVCWITEWFERETLQWLWILLLYFWIGYMSGEVGAFRRKVSWGFETGFVGSDSLNTRQLTIKAMKGGGGLSIENDGGVRIAIENQGERLLLLIQDGQREQPASIDVLKLAALAGHLRERVAPEEIVPELQGRDAAS